MSPAVAEDLIDLTFDGGIPGFPEVHRFALESLGEGTPFAVLRCLDDPGPEFVVVPAGAFFPDYEPELDDASADDLGLESADDAVVLLIVNLAGGVADATANLLGPIVINRNNRRATQVILSGSAYEPRTPLPVH